MGLRVLLGAIASAVALMAWGLLFWVVLGGVLGGPRALPEEAALVDALARRIGASGTYVFPAPPGPEQGAGGAGQGSAVQVAAGEAAAMEAFRRVQMAGPTGVLHLNRAGFDPLAPRQHALAFAQVFAASLVAALLLLALRESLETYSQRAMFVLALGVFAALAVRLYDPVWWHLPWRHFLRGALYDVTAWLVAGMVLAAIVRPGRGAQHLTDPSKPLWKRALEAD